MSLSTSSGYSQNQSSANSLSQSYIPNYSQTPILESIAQYAENMAPQVYQWGMDQYNRNQGNIDSLIRQGQTYASPQQIAADMGMAEAGVQQSGEQARQANLQDLESYGIDPSSGRYAALDNASRVATAAAAAGAGNQQRMADIATGNAMVNQGISSSLQNVNLGYGASNAMNALLSTGMQLKYPPLGNIAQSSSQSSGSSANTSRSVGSAGGGGGGGISHYNPGGGGSGGGGYGGPSDQIGPGGLPPANSGPGLVGGSPGQGTEGDSSGDSGGGDGSSQTQWPDWIGGGGTDPGGGGDGGEPIVPYWAGGAVGYQAGGAAEPDDDGATTGGFVSQQLSPSNGQQTDDVPAQLNAGEFVIPRDVAMWKGQEFFYKLMQQSRQNRMAAGGGGQNQAPQQQPQAQGYCGGGRVRGYQEGGEVDPNARDIIRAGLSAYRQAPLQTAMATPVSAPPVASAAPAVSASSSPVSGLGTGGPGVFANAPFSPQAPPADKGGGGGNAKPGSIEASAEWGKMMGYGCAGQGLVVDIAGKCATPEQAASTLATSNAYEQGIHGGGYGGGGGGDSTPPPAGPSAADDSNQSSAPTQVASINPDAAYADYYNQQQDDSQVG